MKKLGSVNPEYFREKKNLVSRKSLWLRYNLKVVQLMVI